MIRGTVSILFVFAAISSVAQERIENFREAALERAMMAVAEAMPKAAADPERPQYHFGPPAQWNNDPNGPMYYNGWYHLFYQHNPYDDSWENMHWGHARSRDMVHWEHLPIALWPSKEAGENHCFSGCMTVDGSGDPIIFYTSIGDRKPEQWAAVPEDDELIAWKKHEANPILTEDIHGDRKIFDWRDPYVFRADGRIFMVNGGNTNERKGGGAIVALYEAKNDELTEWDYKGIMFTHPDEDVKNIECPNFFPLEGKWVLIVSPHDKVEYFVGQFDSRAGVFTPEQRGIVDHSTNYYAPNGFYDLDGRHILWGWVRGFPDDIGWDGCMTLPRSLTLDSDLRLVQRPAAETKGLRETYVSGSTTSVDLEAPVHILPDVQGRQLEIHVSFRGPAAGDFGLRVRCDDKGQGGVPIRFNDRQLTVDGIPVGEAQTGSVVELDLNVFVDGSVVEVYAFGGSAVITRVAYPEKRGDHVAFFQNAGSPRVQSWNVWMLKPVMANLPMAALESVK